jgi:hypothetical protein
MTNNSYFKTIDEAADFLKTLNVRVCYSYTHTTSANRDNYFLNYHSTYTVKPGDLFKNSCRSYFYIGEGFRMKYFSYDEMLIAVNEIRRIINMKAFL